MPGDGIQDEKTAVMSGFCFPVTLREVAIAHYLSAAATEIMLKTQIHRQHNDDLDGENRVVTPGDREDVLSTPTHKMRIQFLRRV